MTLYFSMPSSPERKAAQTACHYLLSDLLLLLSPVFSFMCEEAFQEYRGDAGENSSVHLQSFKKSCVSVTSTFSWENVGKRLASVFEAASAGSDNSSTNFGERMKNTWENLLKVKQHVSLVVEEKRGKEFKDSYMAKLSLSLVDNQEGLF